MKLINNYYLSEFSLVATKATPKENTTSTPPVKAVTTTSQVAVTNYNGALVANFTLKNTGKYIRGSGAAQTWPIDMTPTAGETRFDCSGWVGYCLNQNYPDLYKALQIGPTSNIIAYGKAHGGVRTSSPIVGDLAVAQRKVSRTLEK